MLYDRGVRLLLPICALALLVPTHSRSQAPAEDAEHAEAPAGPLVPPAEVQQLTFDLRAAVPAAWHQMDHDRFPLSPARWRRRVPRECRTQGGYRDHCSGELLRPRPTEAEAAFAAQLGLGHRHTAKWLMHKRPFDPWMEAVAWLSDSRRLEFPVPAGHMGRGFGRNRRGSLRNRRHNGLDIGAPQGAPIVAARDGLVMYAGNEITGYGNVVVMLHGEGYSTLYGHCHSLLVNAGQWVRRGAQIATVGETGFAWAPHLHFEWRQRGWVRDPAPHLIRPGERASE